MFAKVAVEFLSCVTDKAQAADRVAAVGRARDRCESDPARGNVRCFLEGFLDSKAPLPLTRRRYVHGSGTGV